MIQFYYGSGSPFAWKVWLALEHKGLPYELKLLSFDRGDTRTADFLDINPRGKVPALVHDGFALYESTPIVEYLDDAFPEKPVLPRDIKARAVARRVMAEADGYLFAVQRRLGQQTVFKAPGEGDAAEIAAALKQLDEELVLFDAMLGDKDFFAGDAPTAADYAVYPIVRFFDRVDERRPGYDVASHLLPRLVAWKGRVEALPYLPRTMPPHWSAP